MSIFILQILIYLVLFTVAIKIVAGNNPVGCVFFYPKPVQQRVYDLGLTTPEITRKRKTIFFTALLTGVPVLPVIFIGVWNGITDFRTAYVQVLLFIEIDTCVHTCRSSCCRNSCFSCQIAGCAKKGMKLL